MAQLGDNIVFVQVDPYSHQADFLEKDVLLWNYNDASLKEVGKLRKNKNWALPAVISGRFFPQCNSGMALQYEQTYSGCLDVYTKAGFISPKDSDSVEIVKSEYAETCEFENLYEQTSSCPKGWTGKADDGNCYKVQTIPKTNDGASQFCYGDGAELLQV